jgi:hypothetical protein
MSHRAPRHPGTPALTGGFPWTPREGLDFVNLDVSVAPEIAQLIAPGPGRGLDAGPAATIGELARQLRLITAAPERWWGLVRFDPEWPVRVSLPMDGPAEAWLMIIPPSVPAGSGNRRRAEGDCGCEVVTVVAGEVTEQAIGGGGVATTPLLPGKMRVHGSGQLHQVINHSVGYTVSVHARARQD